MADENLKVAVRVRPFNQREKDANSKLIVSMNGNQTVIRDPKTNDEKKYAYDFSYWSHDGFKTDATGYMSPDGPKYADQKRVYNDLGVGVLNNAWQGYNASLFAYGQTGSGKSYSVVGYGTNRGIVPMVCEEIFQKKSPTPGATTEVSFSMLEIYSEVVRDLLNSKADRKAGLLVREDPKLGFYPQGLTKTLVGSYSEITKLMDEGTANRTIAATNMNATSSRAHTIVTINLVQKYKNDAGKEMAKSSLIYLVDLAGSERADATGATGDRLKEGAAINLSLTSLGNVISALADNSAGKNVRVPYRDSVLTKLLMNALGGNSKTIMIAAISPADINHDESVSTLRYADRAKQIKTKAIVNEDPTEKLIKDLKEENAKLKKMLESGKIDPALAASLGSTGGSNKEADDALKKQLEENDRQMKAMQQSYEEKLAEAQKNTANLNANKVIELSKTIPHLRNVNMDSQLSGTIRHLLDANGSKTIGRPGKADIGLNGIGILDNHASIDCKNFTLTDMPNAKLLRNGVQVTVPVQLNHLDRLLFGTSQYYLFVDPKKAKPDDPYYTFEAMQEEIAKSAGLMTQNNQNMTQAEIQCQTELIDLVPAIEEANAISVAMDKKVIFSALPVPADARGDYDEKIRAFVTVKNYLMNYEWVWPKDKFLDRKADFTEIYNDFRDNGAIDSVKFKNYDPFNESPDTPTQVGAAMVFPKAFANLMATKADYKIISMKSKEAGLLNVELIPCNDQGKVIDTSNIKIHDPKVDLLNKKVNFLFRINEIKGLDPAYEDVYCQFKMYNDPTLYKTETVLKENAKQKGINFQFEKQFTFNATAEFIDFIMNKTLYIQIFAEQVHHKADPNMSKMTTKEYYENQQRMNNLAPIVGREILTNSLDPAKQKLEDDLKISTLKNQQNDFQMRSIARLMAAYGNRPVSNGVLGAVMAARDEAQVTAIINASLANNGSLPPNFGQQQPNPNYRYQPTVMPNPGVYVVQTYETIDYGNSSVACTIS